MDVIDPTVSFVNSRQTSLQHPEKNLQIPAWAAVSKWSGILGGSLTSSYTACYLGVVSGRAEALHCKQKLPR